MEKKGLSQQERMMLLTSELNFISCNVTSFEINHYWLKNDDAAKRLNDIMREANEAIEKVVDNMVMCLDNTDSIDDLQKSILKPINKALAIKDE